MNNTNIDSYLQQLDIGLDYINEVEMQIKNIKEGFYKLQDEIKLKNKQTPKKTRKKRTTLNTYKRYNLNIPFVLKEKYKEFYGDLIQYDGSNWFYIGQLSTMPRCLRNIRIDK